MSTITVWLLISLPYTAGYNVKTPTVLIERFVTINECSRVADLIREENSTRVRCIQATVLKP